MAALMPDAVLAAAAVALLAAAATFQLLLAAGVPWGAAAYGGRVAGADGRLPTLYRVASGGTAVFLIAVAWMVLGAANLVAGPVPQDASTTGALWVLAALFALNTLGNATGRHPAERWGAGGVTAALAVLLALLAAG